MNRLRVALLALSVCAAGLTGCKSLAPYFKPPQPLEPSLGRIIGADVAVVLLVSVEDMDMHGSALDASPIKAGPNRKATARIKKILGGEWTGSRTVEILYDHVDMAMDYGRYVVMLDAQGQWLNWRPVKDGRVEILPGGPTVPVAEAPDRLLGRPAPWP